MTELSFRASRKLESLRRLADDAHAKTLPLLNERQRIENDMSVVAREMDAVPQERQVEYSQVFDGLQGELKKLDAESARRRERAAVEMQLYTRVREWAWLLPHNATVDDVPASPMRPDMGELAKVRGEIFALTGQLKALAAAPLPSGELRKQICAHVDEMARRHSPRIRLTGAGLSIDWSGVDVLGSPAAPFGILCWLRGDMVVARLEREAGELMGGSKGLAKGEREAQVADLSAKLVEKERDEEALVEALLAENVDVARRPDASPAAILCVAVKRPGEAIAA